MSQVNLKKTNTPLAASVGRIGLFIDTDNQGRLIDEFGNVYALAGLQGPPGEGLASGGSTGQVLAKASNSNFDTQWVDQAGGAGTPTEIKTALETLTGNDRLSGDAIQGIITDITAGTNITIDKTNPRIPIISATGGTTDLSNYYEKQFIDSLDSTGSEILFDRPRTYGSKNTPLTASTYTEINPIGSEERKGLVQKLFVQGAAFNPPNTWYKLDDGVNYDPAKVNLITVEYFSSSNKTYNIMHYV